MRIDVVVVISGRDQQALADRQNSISCLASPGTEIKLVVSPDGPASVESQTELELTAPGILQRCIESERSGADGIIIWGGHDPSLEAARELVTIPVIGPGMASIYLAAALARRFGLLVQLPQVIELAKRQVRELGLETRCTGVYSAGVPVLDFGTDAAFQALTNAAGVAVEEGADALCFGCMAMTSQVDEVATSISTSYPGVVVIDPGKAAIWLTESLISMGLSHSKRSYPDLRKPVTFG